MVELEDFKHGGTNITAFRLVNPNDEKVQNVVREWIQGETWHKRQIPFAGKSIKVSKLLAETKWIDHSSIKWQDHMKDHCFYKFSHKKVEFIEAVFFVFFHNFRKYQEIIKLLQLSSI